MVLNNEIKEIVFRLCAKNGHGTPSVPDYNYYANLANIDLFNFYAAPLKTIGQGGKPVERTTFGMNQPINQALRPFIKTATLPVTAGQATIPTDLAVMDTLTSGTKAIKWLPQDKLSAFLNSTIDSPTADYPVYVDLADKFLIYPASITTVDAVYLKTPATVVWAYTLVSGRPVYTSSGTVDFEWGNEQKIHLVTRILSYFGVETRDNELVQLAGNEQQKAS